MKPASDSAHDFFGSFSGSVGLRRRLTRGSAFGRGGCRIGRLGFGRGGSAGERGSTARSAGMPAEMPGERSAEPSARFSSGLRHFDESGLDRLFLARRWRGNRRVPASGRRLPQLLPMRLHDGAGASRNSPLSRVPLSRSLSICRPIASRSASSAASGPRRSRPHQSQRARASGVRWPQKGHLWATGGGTRPKSMRKIQASKAHSPWPTRVITASTRKRTIRTIEDFRHDRTPAYLPRLARPVYQGSPDDSI